MIWSSIVYWAYRCAFARPGGRGGGYKPRITELRYFYILVRSKGYEIGGVRRTIVSKLNRYTYPSFILIQLGSNDLGITKNARFDKQYRM
jgi:hypothetical protein